MGSDQEAVPVDAEVLMEDGLRVLVGETGARDVEIADLAGGEVRHQHADSAAAGTFLPLD